MKNIVETIQISSTIFNVPFHDFRTFLQFSKFQDLTRVYKQLGFSGQSKEFDQFSVKEYFVKASHSLNNLNQIC